MIANTRIVRVGNSRRVRVPKDLPEQAHLSDEVELQTEHGRPIVRAAHRPRAGWAAAAKALHSQGDERILDAPTSTRFDDDDWQWG